MKIRFFEIDWDTDGEDAELPSEVVHEVDDDFNVCDDGADLLSDYYGWCVFGFRWEKA